LKGSKELQEEGETKYTLNSCQLAFAKNGDQSNSSIPEVNTTFGGLIINIKNDILWSFYLIFRDEVHIIKYGLSRVNTKRINHFENSFFS